MRLFLLFVAAILVPAALSYGINLAAVLLKSMSIAVEGTDQTEMLPAVMGPYLGMTIFLRHRRLHALLASCRSDLGCVSLFDRRRPHLQPDRQRVSAPSSSSSWRSSSSAARSGFSCSPASGKLSLGNDIGQELVLDAGDFVLQEQLFLFQALELELIGAA